MFISYDGRPFLTLLLLGQWLPFLQRNNFRYQIQNTKPRYMPVFTVYVAFLEEDENVKFSH